MVAYAHTSEEWSRIIILSEAKCSKSIILGWKTYGIKLPGNSVKFTEENESTAKIKL